MSEGECWIGYTEAELAELLGDRLRSFFAWPNRQTGAICDGRLFNHETREYTQTDCGDGHGLIVYRSDVDRFLGRVAA